MSGTSLNSARTLSSRYQGSASRNQKSLDYKLLTSGLNIKPVTIRLLRMTAGVCSMVIAWLFLPGLPSIVIGGILVFIPGAWLDDCVKSRGRNIDQLLPIVIGHTAAGLSSPDRCS